MVEEGQLYFRRMNSLLAFIRTTLRLKILWPRSACLTIRKMREHEIVLSYLVHEYVWSW